MKKLRTLGLILLLATLLSVTALATEATAPDWTDNTVITVDEIGDITGAGTYYLTTNIKGNLTISGEVNLNLNGYTLTGATDGDSVIIVEEDGTLNLYDTAVDGVASGDGGSITGGTGTTPSGSSIASGGGVYVNGGTFNMYSGTISSNRADNGGGVCVTGGTFTMEGGTISGNSATVTGGGVYLDSSSKFTMTDSSITGNSAGTNGGGVYLGSSCEFTMTSSSIEDNSAGGNGGGVYMLDGTFTMMGSSITDNSAGTNGGGVCMNNGADSFTVSGTETITGNTVNEIDNNVYLWNTGSSTKITIDDGFSAESSIGIILYDVSKAFTSGATADDINCFTPDLLAYTVTPGTEPDTELYLTLDTSKLFTDGNGTIGTPYQIATLEQLSNLALYGKDTVINATTVYYQLTADITLDATYTPIGTATAGFVAQFDGNNHTIGGDIEANANNAGIFTSIGAGGTVKNLYSTVNVTNLSSAAGGIAGTNSGTIENCYATGTITASSDAGGIAGTNSGTIENSYATGTITASSTAGGIAGNNNGGTIQNCYATGDVTASGEYGDAGGIAGYNSGTIENSLSLAQRVTGNTAGRVFGDVGNSTTSSDNYAWAEVLVNDSIVTSNDLTSKDGADLYLATTEFATTGTYGNTGASILGFTQDSYSVTVNTTNEVNIETVEGTYTLILEGETTYDGDEKPSAGVYNWTVYFTPNDAIFPTFPVDSGTVTITAKSTSSNTGTLVTDTSTDDGEDDGTTEVEDEDTTTSETTTPTVAGMDDVFEDDYFAEAVEWAVENDVTTGTSDNGFSPDSPASRGQVVTFLYRAFGEPETDGENTFADVDEDSYYGNAVKWALEMGITAGMADGIFGTEETCTRAQIITFLWRAAGSPEVNSTHDFTDLEAGSYYEMALLWAVENGITNGMGDGTFGVDDPCTRAQIVTFLYRFFN